MLTSQDTKKTDKKKNKKPRTKNQERFATIMKYVGKVFLTVSLIGVITGCIVVTVMSIYILNYVDTEISFDLKNLKLNYTSVIYTQDKNTGEYVETATLHGEENRIWVDYGEIPQYMKDAVVAIEDQHFHTHDGVDWKRTFAAFVNLFVDILGSQQGGSTITQQLIKNVTGEDEVKIERKVQEIFRAINLEKVASKDEILEGYLNVIALGNNINGVQAAAKFYFNKEVKDITLAESACLAAITKNPSRFEPYKNPENNKERRNYILKQMLKQNLISQEEYAEAVATEITITPTYIERYQTYFVEAVIDEVIADLVEYKGYTKKYATNCVYQGGYKIYTTMDYDMQLKLEELYAKDSTFPKNGDGEQPQSAMVIMDYEGRIVALAGGRGKKTTIRGFNRATMSERQPGSTMKPIGVFGQAIEYDKVNYSSIIPDTQLRVDLGDGPQLWPKNWYGYYSSGITVAKALERSSNAAPVKLLNNVIGVSNSFAFLTTRLGLTSLVNGEVVDGQTLSDVNLSALALGGTTYGVIPTEWTAAFMPFGNGGWFTEGYTYTKVVDQFGEVILEPDRSLSPVYSSQTATIMNRLLWRVVNSSQGTGTKAKLDNGIETIGKTGTASETKDVWFVGLNPYYVASVWYGYDTPEEIPNGSGNGCVIYKNVMDKLLEDYEPKKFELDPDVKVINYCTTTGKIARTECPKDTGYYKSYNVPGYCTQHS